jgi:IMP dehydrogenase
MNITTKKGITFDDVLILPQISSITKADPEISCQFTPNIKLELPIISSPMDTVTTPFIAKEMYKNGGIGILHRNKPIEETCKEVELLVKENIKIGVAIGTCYDEEKYKKEISLLIASGISFITIDNAHGATELVFNSLRIINSNFPDLEIVVGNVATYSTAYYLCRHFNISALRVGIGSGNACTTRIVTGIGVPQITAIDEVRKAIDSAKIHTSRKVTLISDGGIKQLGDIAKALGAGADCVMLGKMLSGFDPSLITKEDENGIKWCNYRGMGSLEAMSDSSNNRYYDKKSSTMISEGVSGLVEYKGDLEIFLNQIKGSLKSSFFYVGAKNLKEFHENCEFIEVSNNVIKENHPSLSNSNQKNYF